MSRPAGLEVSSSCVQFSPLSGNPAPGRYAEIARLRNFPSGPSVLPPALMKSKLPLAAALAVLVCASGCATRNTSSGGKETSVLGGAVTVTSDSFQPITPATVNTNTSKIAGKSGPSGKKVSLFWGLLTLHDY